MKIGVGGLGRLGQAGGEEQPLLAHVLGHQLREARLEDRHLAACRAPRSCRGPCRRRSRRGRSRQSRRRTRGRRNRSRSLLCACVSHFEGWRSRRAQLVSGGDVSVIGSARQCINALLGALARPLSLRPATRARRGGTDRARNALHRERSPAPQACCPGNRPTGPRPLSGARGNAKPYARVHFTNKGRGACRAGATGAGNAGPPATRPGRAPQPCSAPALRASRPPWGQPRPAPGPPGRRRCPVEMHALLEVVRPLGKQPLAARPGLGPELGLAGSAERRRAPRRPAARGAFRLLAGERKQHRDSRGPPPAGGTAPWPRSARADIASGQPRESSDMCRQCCCTLLRQAWKASSLGFS